MLRKLLSHAAIYGLAAQLPRLAGILTLPIVTQYVTTTDYGIAGVITAYVGGLSIVQSLGLSTIMVNSFARFPTKYKWIWRQLHGFLLLWGLVFGFILGVALYFGIPDEAINNRWLIIALCVLPAILFNSTDLQAMLFYQMKQQPLKIAVRSFVVGTVVVGLNIYTIAYLHLGYLGWFYSNFFGSVLGFVMYGWSYFVKEQMWPILRFKWHRIKSSLRTALPVVPHNFSFFLLDTSDKLVLDVLNVPLPRIGFYNLASSFGLYFMAASNAVVQASAPFYMQYYSTEAADKSAAIKARSMTFAMQAFFLVITFLLGLWLKEIFILLIRNSDLQQAYPLAIIILMGYNFRPMYLGAINQLVYKEHTKILWKVSTVAGIGNLVLNFALVPVFGIQAAAFTTFAALMYMGYAGYFLKEYKQIALINYRPWFWLSATILSLVVVYVLADSELLAKVWLTAGISLVAGTGFVYANRKLKL